MDYVILDIYPMDSYPCVRIGCGYLFQILDESVDKYRNFAEIVSKFAFSTHLDRLSEIDHS